mmetsp:Transcript_18155/g.13202  ORF Transcript_18155/g.13202 Transcript_18155/m.13202 type:complete len:257 (+) Transcript_18155:42-812(+)
MIPIDQSNRYPFGKLLVEVHCLKNFPFYSNLFVKLTCNPWVLGTRRIPTTELDFNQRFFFPVHNHFATLKVELINSTYDGWFRDHKKETVITSFEIRLPDLHKDPFDYNGNIRIPVSDQIDFKKLGLKAVQDAELKVKQNKAYLYMRVVDMTRVDSMFIANPNRDIVEDRKFKYSYGFKEINTVMTRLKLLIYLILYLKGIDRPVLYFDYPRHSYLWCFGLISLTYFFNPNYLLTYLLCLSLLILASNSEMWQRTV